MQQLTRILKDLQKRRKQVQSELDHLQAAITALRGLNGRRLRLVSSNAGSSKRPLSASARKRISAAQKARWAKWKAQQRKSAA
jgi:hypothetical protein